MSEVGLCGRERARTVEAVYLGQAGEFDGVAGRGAGAVCLHHADGAGIHTGRGQRRPIGRDLRGSRRCRDGHGMTVLVGCRAAHHSQDPVTISLCIR